MENVHTIVKLEGLKVTRLDKWHGKNSTITSQRKFHLVCQLGTLQSKLASLLAASKSVEVAILISEEDKRETERLIEVNNVLDNSEIETG